MSEQSYRRGATIWHSGFLCHMACYLVQNACIYNQNEPIQSNNSAHSLQTLCKWDIQGKTDTKKCVAEIPMSLTDCDNTVSMTETSPALSHLIYVTGHAGACVWYIRDCRDELLDFWTFSNVKADIIHDILAGIEAKRSLTFKDCDPAATWKCV